MADREDFATAVGVLIKTRATKTELTAGIAGVDFYGGGLPLNANLADYTYPKAYAVSSATVAASITPALPTVARNIGVMEVLRASSGGYYHYRWTVIGGNHRGVYENTYQSGTWTGWRKTDSPTPEELDSLVSSVLEARDLPNGANIDTYVRAGGEFDGWWQSPSAAATATMTGLPEGEDSLFTLHVLPGTGYQMIQFYGGGLYWRAVNSASQGTFAPWARLDRSPDEAMIESAERHARTDQARMRAGGRIGTAGLPTLALRFDDWADEMETIIMPELRSRNLPAGWAATVSYVETHSTQTWATVQAWVRDGIELLGHSWTHTNATGTAGLHKEIIESADYIETKVPNARIDTWVMPGVLDGIATYDNFGSANIPENFYQHEAGRMILRRYPIVNGEAPGRHAPLVGQPAMGQKHGTVEYDTLPQAKDELQAAMDAGTGVTLMVHPAKLSTEGKMSVADFILFLDWVVELRDAEKLLVLTPRGQAHADRDSEARLNLFTNHDFRNGVTGWDNSTGWTVERNGPRAWATTSTGTPLQQAVPVIEYGYLRGGVVEVAVLVRARGSVARIRTGITGVANVHTINPADGWTWVRTVATVPYTLGDSDSLDALVGRHDGGTVDIAHAAIRPV